MYHSIRRAISISLVALAFGATFSPSHAQDALDTPEEEEAVLDAVVVTGGQEDAAMIAFRAGDFATAEIEFLDNARCALRRERNIRASIETSQIEADRADAFADAASSNSGASTRGAGAGAPQDIPVGIAASNSIASRNTETELDRTCEKRGRQLYFAGLSQIQLGKTDEALRNFERATVASKVLYDAHYKIALIKLLEGDPKTAESELKKIERILERCRNCEAKQEIIDRRDHLAKAISGEVSLQ